MLSSSSYSRTENGAQLQQLSLSTQGEILNIAGQEWYQSGGRVITAYIMGSSINPSSASLNYKLHATVKGVSADGGAVLSFAGTTSSGQSVTVQGDVQINDFDTGLCFPLTSNLLDDCQNPDFPTGYTSAIPEMWEGSSNFKVSIAGQTFNYSPSMYIESAATNPFGGPIVISSVDGGIFIVATYNRGIVQWRGMESIAIVSGKLGATPVTGSFTQTYNAVENFVSGKVYESGSIAFLNMNVPSLDGTGNFIGTAAISTSGTMDCSSLAGTPEGTCLITGLNSLDQFVVQSGSSTIYGTLVKGWSMPAAAFEGSISAFVVQTVRNGK